MSQHKAMWVRTDRTTTVYPAGGGEIQATVYHVYCSCGWEHRLPEESRVSRVYTIDDGWFPVTEGAWPIQQEALNVWWSSHIRRELFYGNGVCEIEIK